jgi:hypothetical protein
MQAQVGVRERTAWLLTTPARVYATNMNKKLTDSARLGQVTVTYIDTIPNRWHEPFLRLAAEALKTHGLVEAAARLSPALVRARQNLLLPAIRWDAPGANGGGCQHIGATAQDFDACAT